MQAKKSGGPEADAAPSQFGERLRRWRTERGVTLRDVSDSSGISIAYLSDLERGKLANPTLDTLTALARALGVSLNELLGIADEPESISPLPPPLQEFSTLPAFREVAAAQAAKWKMAPDEVEQGWLDSLASIRIGRHAPRTSTDYQFIFEAARRVLD